MTGAPRLVAPVIITAIRDAVQRVSWKPRGSLMVA
jgi:hypothetical protein